MDSLGQAAFDVLLCQERREDPDNTLFSTSSPDTTAHSLAMSVPFDVNYPPSDSETLRSRDEHRVFLEEIRRSVEEHGEHPDVFYSQSGTTSDSSNSSKDKISRSGSLPPADPELNTFNKSSDFSHISPNNLLDDAVYLPTDDDAGDEGELTSGGEEDIMAQFGSEKKMAEFVDALDVGAEAFDTSSIKKVRLLVHNY